MSGAGLGDHGFAQSDPALRPLIDANTSAAGKAALQEVSTMCVGDAVLGYAFTSSTKWTVSGKSISEILASIPEVQAVLDKQRIGTLKPVGPVRLATGVQDDIVPHAQARQFAVDWCLKGGNVSYVPIAMADLGDKTLLNHLAPLLGDQGDAVSWLIDRLEGKPALSHCWTMPFQP